jgi:hypothetical protein
MTIERFTIIDETRPNAVEVEIDRGRVRLSAAVIGQALGWELKPQGLCRGETCIPVGRDSVDERGIDLGALAELLSRPLAADVGERVACLGASVAERAAKLSSLEAPDFALPDLSGNIHHLSDHRGKKVLLVAYASW